MSETQAVVKRGHLLPLAALAVVCALGCLYVLRGRDASTDTAPTAPDPALTGTRYKVPVSMSQPVRGAADALVTIVEWGDFRSDASRLAARVLAQLEKKYGADLRIVHRQLPSADDESMLINYFARGAFDVASKFWEVRESLLAIPQGAPVTRTTLQGIADENGIDWQAIERGIERRDFARYVGVDILFAGKFGVDETPALFVNGRRLPLAENARMASSLDALVAQELTNARAVAARGVERAKVYDTIIEDGSWGVDDAPEKRKAPLAASARQGE